MELRTFAEDASGDLAKFQAEARKSLFEEAKRVAESEGVALNQLINVAVAEKLSALRTEDYFRERASRANLAKVQRILKRTGRGKPPVAGDEIE
jgi:hypothetical protein